MFQVNRDIILLSKCDLMQIFETSAGMTVFQNKLLSQDADSSYDNSDDRDALAIGPNKDNSSEENRCSCFYSKPNYYL